MASYARMGGKMEVTYQGPADERKSVRSTWQYGKRPVTMRYLISKAFSDH
jgi:hypothetical protein